ncbi:MAG: DUF4105 domain-containing protein [Ferruginibacter sp.]
MKMPERILLHLFIIFSFSHFAVNSFAQDSSRIRVSLLTCTPGNELYSIFGHSALRVVDSSSVTDIVYNYGTFNFDDEGFYLKFIRGKLLYSLSVENFNDDDSVIGFKSSYQLENRGITEQVLNFSAAEKISLQHALIENLKEENRHYKYDFFLDNCTTRLRDLIVKNKHRQPLLPAVMPTHYRFRQAIHQYLNAGKQYWGKLGIDILLGAPTDAVMTASQQQFLPDNLMMALDSAKIFPLVQSSENLFATQLENNDSWFTPMFFFTALLCLYILLSFSSNKKLKLILSGLDILLFFITGLLGILLVFMWIATDHTMTKNNYNLLWALPTHIVFAAFIKSSKVLVKKYFFITAVILVLLLLSWFFLPQQMSTALIPFVMLLLFRSVSIYLKK